MKMEKDASTERHLNKIADRSETPDSTLIKIRPLAETVVDNIVSWSISALGFKEISVYLEYAPSNLENPLEATGWKPRGTSENKQTCPVYTRRMRLGSNVHSLVRPTRIVRSTLFSANERHQIHAVFARRLRYTTSSSTHTEDQKEDNTNIFWAYSPSLQSGIEAVDQWHPSLPSASTLDSILSKKLKDKERPKSAKTATDPSKGTEKQIGISTWWGLAIFRITVSMLAGVAFWFLPGLLSQYGPLVHTPKIVIPIIVAALLILGLTIIGLTERIFAINKLREQSQPEGPTHSESVSESD